MLCFCYSHKYPSTRLFTCYSQMCRYFGFSDSVHLVVVLMITSCVFVTLTSIQVHVLFTCYSQMCRYFGFSDSVHLVVVLMITSCVFVTLTSIQVHVYSLVIVRCVDTLASLTLYI